MHRALFLALAVAVTAQAQSPAEQVIAAERAFARTAQQKPVRQAFLDFLADSGQLLGVAGRTALSQGPEWPFRLQWGPVSVGVSGAGDLAWSTGPARRLALATDAVGGYSSFATIWQRQPSGEWRVLLDVGIDTPTPDRGQLDAVLAERYVPSVATSTPRVVDSVATMRALEDLEVAARRSIGGAVGVPPLDRYVRLLRSDRAPIVGLDAVRDSLARWQGPLTLTVLHAGVSRSRDFAWRAGRYVFGTGEGAERGNHLRVWRLDPDGRWRIALEVWSRTRE